MMLNLRSMAFDVSDSKSSFKPLPDVMVKLLEDGGLVEHIKKHGGFKLT